MVPAQGQAGLSLSAMATERSVRDQSPPTTAVLPVVNQCAPFDLIFNIPSFSSLFCLVIFTRAAGNLVVYSGHKKPRMIIIGLIQLPDPPDAHCLLMGLLISLMEWLVLKAKTGADTGHRLRAGTAKLACSNCCWWCSFLGGWAELLPGWPG